MSNWLRLALSLILCLVIVVSSLMVIGGFFLRNTLFGDQFYQQIIASPIYLPMVKEAIRADFAAQSAYIGIPVEYLENGLDDATLYMMERNHIDNAVAFLNYEADFVKPTYPAGLFYDQLVPFIKSFAAANGQTVTEDQLNQLKAVAADAALIVQQNVCLLDLDLVRQSALFQRVHRLLYQLSYRLIWAAALLLLSIAALIVLNRQSWRSWLNQVLISFWLAGSLLLAPFLVLELFALPRRLAIETAYLKYALDRLLTGANQFFIFWGASIFFITSVALVTLFMTKPKRKHSDFAQFRYK